MIICYFFSGVKITKWKLLYKRYHPVKTLDWLHILYLKPKKKVVSVENDAVSYHVPNIFLRARMVYTGSAKMIWHICRFNKMQIKKRNKNVFLFLKSTSNAILFHYVLKIKSVKWDPLFSANCWKRSRKLSHFPEFWRCEVGRLKPICNCNTTSVPFALQFW